MLIKRYMHHRERGDFNFHKGVKLNEGGLVFVEGVKLTEPEYPKGVKLTEPDLLIACVSPVHLFFNIFICLHQQNSLQVYYNDSQHHIPESYY